jgi:hypothetical protein
MSMIEVIIEHAYSVRKNMSVQRKTLSMSIGKAENFAIDPAGLFSSAIVFSNAVDKRVNGNVVGQVCCIMGHPNLECRT